MENISEYRATKFDKFKSKYLSLKFLTFVVAQTLCYVFAVGICFVVAYPLILKFCNAFKSLNDFYDPNVVFIPRVITSANWRQCWYALDVFGTIGTRTLLYTTLLASIQTIICTLAGYGFARFKFLGKRLVFALVMFTLIVPPQTIITPLYTTFRSFDIGAIIQADGTISNPGIISRIFGHALNLRNTYWPLIIMCITGVYWKNGMYIYLMRQYFKGIPTVLEEAAYIDGAKTFKAFLRIMLPPAFGMMLTIFIFSFCWQWMDTTFTRAFMPDIRLLATTVMTIKNGEETVESMLRNTAVLIVMAPLLILYTFVQNFFVESIERSGITG